MVNIARLTGIRHPHICNLTFVLVNATHIFLGWGSINTIVDDEAAKLSCRHLIVSI